MKRLALAVMGVVGVLSSVSARADIRLQCASEFGSPRGADFVLQVGAPKERLRALWERKIADLWAHEGFVDGTLHLDRAKVPFEMVSPQLFHSAKTTLDNSKPGVYFGYGRIPGRVELYVAFLLTETFESNDGSAWHGNIVATNHSPTEVSPWTLLHESGTFVKCTGTRQSVEPRE